MLLVDRRIWNFKLCCFPNLHRTRKAYIQSFRPSISPKEWRATLSTSSKVRHHAGKNYRSIQSFPVSPNPSWVTA